MVEEIEEVEKVWNFSTVLTVLTVLTLSTLSLMYRLHSKEMHKIVDILLKIVYVCIEKCVVVWEKSFFLLFSWELDRRVV